MQVRPGAQAAPGPGCASTGMRPAGRQAEHANGRPAAAPAMAASRRGGREPGARAGAMGEKAIPGPGHGPQSRTLEVASRLGLNCASSVAQYTV